MQRFVQCFERQSPKCKPQSLRRMVRRGERLGRHYQNALLSKVRSHPVGPRALRKFDP